MELYSHLYFKVWFCWITLLELIDELILLATHMKYYDGPIVI